MTILQASLGWSDEATSVEPVRSWSNPLRLTQGKNCQAAENLFRKELLQNISKGKERITELKSCFDSSPKPTAHSCNTSRKTEVEAILNSLNSYRESSKKLYSRVAEKWLSDLPQGQNREVE